MLELAKGLLEVLVVTLACGVATFVLGIWLPWRWRRCRASKKR